MNRTGMVATTLGALLSLGVCGAASAHGQTPGSTEQQGSSAQAPSTQQGTAAGDKQVAQQQFDREKATLKDQLQGSISEADRNIDALNKMKDSDKGALKTRDADQEKHLTALRDHLKADLEKIDSSSVSDWTGLRPTVERDLGSMSSELARVAAITKIPRTGTANTQGQGSPTQPPKAPNP